MKKIIIFAAIGLAGIMLSSCAGVITNTKDIKYMPIRFKPLSRNDFTLVGNLQAEATIAYKVSKQGKQLDKAYAGNYKTGLITNQYSTTEILYFAPGPNESITGSLYENDIFQTVYGTAGTTTGVPKKPGIIASLLKLFFGSKGAANAAPAPAKSDDGLNFAYYALVEKYPDIDYFINVRFDRKTVAKGSKFTETVIVKADGVKLRTD